MLQVDSDYAMNLKEARRIIEADKRNRRIQFWEKATQKLYGLGIAAIGIAVPFVLDGDITASVVLVPIGIYMIFYK